jgi:hypothetical protein
VARELSSKARLVEISSWNGWKINNKAHKCKCGVFVFQYVEVFRKRKAKGSISNRGAKRSTTQCTWRGRNLV